MIFNSLIFLVFIGIFLPIYFGLKGKSRLIFTLLASYFFYGWWDWRFLSLIVFSTGVDYVIGLKLGQTEKKQQRKQLLIASMVVNLGFLGFFKYFNFFIDSFKDLMHQIGFFANFDTLNIILPVGISFYTFQSMSYTIDVFRKQIPVEKDFLKFATYISFFPQLVAGPIVRAKDFLPQFSRKIQFNWDRFILGLAQILLGFFKKVAIADSIAEFVDLCFQNPDKFSTSHLLVGVIMYSFQIYADFSGYSDIAIGLARIMGFDFPKNFRTPYFSKSFSEFWTRWHISLSEWLRDYLYIPLGGNRGGSFGSYFFILLFMGLAGFMTGSKWIIGISILISVFGFFFMKTNNQNQKTAFNYMNLMVTMLLGGLWHGSNWTFVFWGFLHGFYLILQRLLGSPIGNFLDAIKIPKVIQTGLSILIVYSLTCFAWIFFRAPDFENAIQYINGIVAMNDFRLGSIVNKFWVIKGTLLIGGLLVVELLDIKYNLSQLLIKNTYFRVASLAILLWVIAFFGTFGSNSFIYFQF